MSRTPAPGSSASVSPLGVLRHWLQSRADEFEASSVLPLDALAGPSPGAVSALRVLVVDDDPFNRALMTAQMAALGLVPLLAEDGAEAVAYACEVPFDLILMDLQMPILDGLAATTAIRHFEARHGRAPVPVVAHSSACVANRVLAAHGLNGSLNKPCVEQELKDCLLQWCPSLRPGPAERGLAIGHPTWPARAERPAGVRA